VLDLLALAFVLGGAIGYVISYLGLERLRATEVAFVRGMQIQQLAEHDRLTLLSWWALAAILSGLACGVYSWRRERRRASAP
jgi:hypothetical protein